MNKVKYDESTEALEIDYLHGCGCNGKKGKKPSPPKNKSCDCENLLPSSNDEIKFLIRRLRNEVKELMTTTNARILCYQNQIDELSLYIKNNLSNYLTKLLNSMLESGELETLITDVIAEEIETLKNMIVYYYDEDLIFSEKYRDEETETDYYVTHVKKYDKDGNRLKLKFGVADDDDNLGKLESTVEFAHRKNASLCINGGIYNTSTYKPLGICIKDKEILNNDSLTLSKYDYLGIDKCGDLHSFDYKTTAKTMLAAGMVDAFCCFTTLIKDGQNVELADTTMYDPRNSIGQLANGDYIIVTVDGRTPENAGFRYPDLQRIFQSYGAQFAIALDGGGSASTVVRGIKENDDIDSSFNDRPVANFLYIVKENADVLNPSLNPFNKIGWLKQRLYKLVNTKINFDKGYIRLRAPKGQYWPGIEIYSNGSTTRNAKIGYTDDPDSITRILMSINIDGTETNVFGANEEGLRDVNGLLASINRKPIVIDNCNTIKHTGLYRCTSSTLNKPYDCVISYIMHVSMYDEYNDKNGNARQIFFSKDKDWFFTRTINENGSFNDWRPLANYKGATSDRPAGVTGIMFFDTTLDKPIWYDGTKWVDANGTQV